MATVSTLKSRNPQKMWKNHDQKNLPLHIVSALISRITQLSLYLVYLPFIKSVLRCHGHVFSLISIGNVSHLPVPLTFSCNCTCCLCLHSFQVFAYCDCPSFLTILIQTYWSLKDNFLWNIQNILCKCTWHGYTQHSKQGISSILFHIWLLKHDKFFICMKAHIHSHPHTISFNWLLKTRHLFPDFLICLSFMTVVPVSPFLSSFKVMFLLLMKHFFRTDLLWSMFMPFLSLQPITSIKMFLA